MDATTLKSIFDYFGPMGVALSLGVYFIITQQRKATKTQRDSNELELQHQIDTQKLKYDAELLRLKEILAEKTAQYDKQFDYNSTILQKLLDTMGEVRTAVEVIRSNKELELKMLEALSGISINKHGNNDCSR